MASLVCAARWTGGDKGGPSVNIDGQEATTIAHQLEFLVTKIPEKLLYSSTNERAARQLS